jgi:hypothetical protein
MFYPEYSLVGSSTVSATDNTTKLSSWVSMAGHKWVDFIINTTDADADTTVDAKLQSADDSSGTNAADISGLAITQFTAAATAKQAILRVRADQLNGDDDYVGCTVTAGNGTSGSVTSIIAIGFSAHYEPAADAATLVQRKVI